jgi:hypothetical protein
MLTKTGLSATAEPSSLPQSFDPEDAFRRLLITVFEVWPVGRSKRDNGSHSKIQLALACGLIQKYRNR